MTALAQLLPVKWLQCLAQLPAQDEASVLGLLAEIECALGAEERAGATIFPARVEMFRAFELTAPAQVRAVILGQDPYHGGQAHGLSFSVQDGVKRPPSLRNILAELESDCGIAAARDTSNLSLWAQRGVLLLNSALSVRAGEAGSHAAIGWQAFSDLVISAVAAQQQACVFFLWGRYAASKSPLIDTTRHLIIESAHPSPLSAYRGFFGSRPFSRCNVFLQNKQRASIDWSL